MAQVELTIIPLKIEGPLKIPPFDCPCCGEQLVIDRMSASPDRDTGEYRVGVIHFPR